MNIQTVGCEANSVTNAIAVYNRLVTLTRPDSRDPWTWNLRLQVVDTSPMEDYFAGSSAMSPAPIRGRRVKRAEDSCPRRQLKPHQPFAIVNAPKSKEIRKEARGRVRIIVSHARHVYASTRTCVLLFEQWRPNGRLKDLGIPGILEGKDKA